MTTIKREYDHKTLGHIGAVTLTVPDGEWTLDGKVLPAASVEYLANFALQCLQDAYAGADTLAEAKGKYDKKLDSILNGMVRVNAGQSDVEKTIDMIAKREFRAALSKDDRKKFDEMDAADTKVRLDAFIKAHADNGRDWTADATADIERRRAEAAEKAAKIAEAMTAVAKAKIDLAAILKL